MLMCVNLRVRARGCSCSAVQCKAEGCAELLVARTGKLALHGTAAGALIQWFWALTARSKGPKTAMQSRALLASVSMPLVASALWDFYPCVCEHCQEL